MANPLTEPARQLPAMVDLGQVDEDTAVEALAEHASWRAGRLRETALELQPVRTRHRRPPPPTAARLATAFTALALAM